jgi:hypothetical protein
MISKWKGVPLFSDVEARVKCKNTPCSINAINRDTSEIDSKTLTLKSLSIKYHILLQILEIKLYIYKHSTTIMYN